MVGGEGMRPATDIVLNAMVAGMDHKLTQLPSGPERMMLFGLRTALAVIARNADDAAAMRLEEIQQLSALLRDAAPTCPPEIGGRLVAAADEARSAERDIRVSALERRLDVLRVALIELQMWLETSSSSRAPALLAQCWEFLARANARREFQAKPW